MKSRQVDRSDPQEPEDNIRSAWRCCGDGTCSVKKRSNYADKGRDTPRRCLNGFALSYEATVTRRRIAIFVPLSTCSWAITCLPVVATGAPPEILDLFTFDRLTVCRSSIRPAPTSRTSTAALRPLSVPDQPAALPPRSGSRSGSRFREIKRMVKPQRSSEKQAVWTLNLLQQRVSCSLYRLCKQAWQV
jgi:hypothetical protein